MKFTSLPEPLHIVIFFFCPSNSPKPWNSSYELSYFTHTFKDHLILLHSILLFHCANVILNSSYYCLTVKYPTSVTYLLITTLANIYTTSVRHRCSNMGNMIHFFSFCYSSSNQHLALLVTHRSALVYSDTQKLYQTSHKERRAKNLKINREQTHWLLQGNITGTGTIHKTTLRA